MFPPKTNKGSNFKNGLKFLAHKFLSIEIQKETHDSIQDATTVMQLFKLKLEKGKQSSCPFQFPFLRTLTTCFQIIQHQLRTYIWRSFGRCGVDFCHT